MKDEKVTSKKSQTKTEESIEDIVGQDSQVEKLTLKKNTMGLVVNCAALNLRKTPYANGFVETILHAGSKVKINESQSTQDFYKIETNDGFSGYCMKQFIKVY